MQYHIEVSLFRHPGRGEFKTSLTEPSFPTSCISPSPIPSIPDPPLFTLLLPLSLAYPLLAIMTNRPIMWLWHYDKQENLLLTPQITKKIFKEAPPHFNNVMWPSLLLLGLCGGKVTWQWWFVHWLVKGVTLGRWKVSKLDGNQTEKPIWNWY